MDPYPATLLKKKDLVLVEMWLCRYFLKDDKGRYSQHHAQFELQAISLLHSGGDFDCQEDLQNDIGNFHRSIVNNLHCVVYKHLRTLQKS
ncbi:hypothetical protein PISMIDRAFT_19572 [Pisolithus microcarpus 441]|uniref:Uncharacterized protein n=1 Tax=Pisolithus microcarpus 441 TaxID=765257 RepID=A0A0C9YU16_9AGAM|nr:hypothetical protein PISMIDRAFT_19572 [Pisolithus microcarpus 441]